MRSAAGDGAALFLLEYADGFEAALLHGQGAGSLVGGWAYAAQERGAGAPVAYAYTGNSESSVTAPRHPDPRSPFRFSTHTGIVINLAMAQWNRKWPTGREGGSKRLAHRATRGKAWSWLFQLESG